MIWRQSVVHKSAHENRSHILSRWHKAKYHIDQCYVPNTTKRWLLSLHCCYRYIVKSHFTRKISIKIAISTYSRKTAPLVVVHRDFVFFVIFNDVTMSFYVENRLGRTVTIAHCMMNYFSAIWNHSVIVFGWCYQNFSLQHVGIHLSAT